VRGEQFISRLSSKTAIRDLLQLCLIIALGGRTANFRNEKCFYYSLRRLQTAIGINCADDRFKGGGQDGGLVPSSIFFLAFTKEQLAVEANLQRFEGESSPINN